VNGCQIADPLGIATITIGEPRVNGDQATITYREITATQLGAGITTGRSGASYVVRLQRTAGVWSMRCKTQIGSDAPANPTRVNAACPP
jgi:hypothetical protein